MLWLPEPTPGTPVALGFDGSDVGDWTAIRAETVEGLSFTPRFAGEPTVWNPEAWPDHRIPRDVVSAAVAHLFDRFKVELMYCDPPGWQSEIEAWARLHGANRVVRWETYQPRRMSDALERFVTDLRAGTVKHDGCPVTATHVGNAVKMPRKNDTYILAKASKPQKIDAAMATVLAHEAACDARSNGWHRPRRNAEIIVLS